MGADAAEPKQRFACRPGKKAFEDRPSDLLTTDDVARCGRHHHSSLNQAGELIDLLGIVEKLLAVNEWVTLSVWHDRGSNLDISTLSHFGMRWLALP